MMHSDMLGLMEMQVNWKIVVDLMMSLAFMEVGIILVMNSIQVLNVVVIGIMMFNNVSSFMMNGGVDSFVDNFVVDGHGVENFVVDGHDVENFVVDGNDVDIISVMIRGSVMDWSSMDSSSMDRGVDIFVMNRNGGVSCNWRVLFWLFFLSLRLLRLRQFATSHSLKCFHMMRVDIVIMAVVLGKIRSFVTDHLNRMMIAVISMFSNTTDILVNDLAMSV